MKILCKNRLLTALLSLLFLIPARGEACTGISLRAKNGAYIQARTIEWSAYLLESQLIVSPRGHEEVSYTPTGENGLRYRSKYGFVGISLVDKKFIAEGINEAGLSAGLYYFPKYGSYAPYNPDNRQNSLSDMELVNWMLGQFATVDEVIANINNITVIPVVVEEGKPIPAVHWRVGDPSGKQIVIEIVNGKVNIYDNVVGVITNSPGFPWQVTNLNNYVNLRSDNPQGLKIGSVQLVPFGAGSGMLGLPGDFTPPSRFVRAAVFTATAPVAPNGEETVLLSFHLLNNFDVPIGTEIQGADIKDLPSATQWTSSIDLTDRVLYYKTCFNTVLRKVDLKTIDFGNIPYLTAPLDESRQETIINIDVKNHVKN